MKTPLSRKRSNRSQTPEWPRKVTVGRETVTVYRRLTPVGNFAFKVANYSNGARRFDCYPNEAEAMEAANKLARQMSERDVLAAAMTNDQAAEYAGSVQKIKPFNVSLLSVADTVADCLGLVGSLSALRKASEDFEKRHRAKLPQKTVREIVDELVEAKKAVKTERLKKAGINDAEKIEATLKRDPYLADLRYRLGAFADTFQTNIANVTAPEIQRFLDGLKGRNGGKLSGQSSLNFRTVIVTLFRYAKRRGYLLKDNDETGNLEKPDSGDGTITTYTAVELTRLLKAASKDFRPCLAIGAFAGLRSSEIERLTWADVDLTRKFITVKGARKRGTPSRRVVPITDNLLAWLTPHAKKKTGKVWTGSHDDFYDAQQDTAAATADPEAEDDGALEWKHNALRHSFISYRLATVQNINQVALEAGNSATTIHAHYNELVGPDAAKEWFSIVPTTPANVVTMPTPTVAAAQA